MPIELKMPDDADLLLHGSSAGLCLGLAFEIHIMNTVPVHQMTCLLLIILVGCSRCIGEKCYSDLYNRY